MRTPFLNFKKKPISFILGLALISVTVFSGCDEDEDEPQAVAKQANVQVVHASPDAPAVDLLIDDVKINSAGLAFPNNTAYLKVNEGLRNFKINVSGSPTPTTVINVNVDLKADKNYSVFAIDSVKKISAIAYEDNLDAPKVGFAKVRFIHLSPNAPAVDVTTDTGVKLFSNQEFEDASGFLEVTPATYNLQVKVAGTATLALPVPGVKFESGKIYTIFAKGFLGGIGAQELGAQIIVNK